jgi:hypothetical protein
MRGMGPKCPLINMPMFSSHLFGTNNFVTSRNTILFGYAFKFKFIYDSLLPIWQYISYIKCLRLLLLGQRFPIGQSTIKPHDETRRSHDAHPATTIDRILVRFVETTPDRRLDCGQHRCNGGHAERFDRGARTTSGHRDGGHRVFCRQYHRHP